MLDRPPTPRPRIITWSIALLAAFAFRLLFGLSREFFFADETQIFLLGLRHYATGTWPYFGADIVWTKSEIPGALLPLLVGLPFRIVPVPEAPYVLLNVLSMLALAAFAWYLTTRLPQLPKWLIWGWLMTLPWTLELSTHIINPSYLLAAALVFFIAFFEAVPQFRRGKMPRSIAFALMGAALAWSVQIHMSWPLLVPYAALAWASGWRLGARSMVVDALVFVSGFFAVAVLLIPTFVVYGIDAGSGGTLRSLRLRPVNPSVAVTTLARLFSFASLEIWRFLETDDSKRVMLLVRHLWIVPMAVVVWAAGVWQPIWMVREWFRSGSPFAEWRPLKWLVVGTVALVYSSYWFVLEPPQAHAFYVVAPVAFVFAAYCWTFVDSPRWRKVAGTIMGVNVVFHAAQAWIVAPEHSLYRHRDVVAAAVRLKEPEIFAHRRDFARAGGPSTLSDSSRPSDSHRDVQFSNVHLTVGPGRVALWTVTLHNHNDRVAYRDVVYLTSYRDADGKAISHRTDYLEEILQPEAAVVLEVNDGFVPAQYVSATIEVLGAEALLPVG